MMYLMTCSICRKDMYCSDFHDLTGCYYFHHIATFMDFPYYAGAGSFQPLGLLELGNADLNL